MEAYRQEIIIAAVLIYLLICIVTGLWAMRRTRDSSDFFVAGRGLGPIVLSLAIFSSTLSGFGFVGGPGLVYSTGVSSFWMIVSGVVGYAISFTLVAKRIRMVAELRNSISLPDVVAARYNSEAARFLVALTIVLGVMGYLATQILAMSLVMHSILSATERFADIPLIVCALLSSAVLIFYCVTGGIIASVYTDVIQGAIMIVSGVLILLTASSIFDGGLTQASQIILQDDAEAVMPFGTFGIVVCIGWFFVFGLGVAGQPHVITKMMMNKRIADNRTILPMTVVGYLFAALLWVAIGVVMRALVVAGETDPLPAVDQAAPVFLSVFANPLLAGVVFAALFAAIMSTSDAFLNVGTAAIIHDIPRAITGRPVKNELLGARIVTVVLAVLATAFALFSYYVNGALVALLGAFGWATFAAAIFPVVAIGLNWKGATRQGAIVAISLSLLINFAFQIFSFKLPFGIGGGVIAFLVSLTVFIAVSLLTRAREGIDADIERMMDI